MKRACLTGITGQTGSYLAELLLEKGYEVHGLVRRSSSFNTGRIDHIFDQLHLVFGDLSDYGSISNWVQKVKPDLFFNLGAQSHVKVSFEIPEYTMDVTGTGVLRCLEAIRNYNPETRILTSSSSELYGGFTTPQNELTPFHPRSPYGVAKLAGFWSVVNYREAYNMFAVNTITFNNESPRRGETFVTKKITRAATRIKLGLQDKLVLGNTTATRDWSHAKDVAEGMILALEAPTADEWVISSGKSYSIQEFVEKVFNKLDLNWQDYVTTDPKYLRPSEVQDLCGDSTKIRTQLGWKPKYSFDDLVDEMVEGDLRLAHNEKLLLDLNKPKVKI
jgi:GDPmannose 4,6-dehydratase